VPVSCNDGSNIASWATIGRAAGKASASIRSREPRATERGAPGSGSNWQRTGETARRSTLRLRLPRPRLRWALPHEVTRIGRLAFGLSALREAEASACALSLARISARRRGEAELERVPAEHPQDAAHAS